MAEGRAFMAFDDQESTRVGEKETDSIIPVVDEPPVRGTSKYDVARNKELDENLTGQTLLKLPSGEFWGTECDLDENAYGAAAVAMVRDITKLSQQWQEGSPWEAVSLTLTRLLLCFGLMVANLIFQGLILWYIYIFVVRPSVRTVQMRYADFHADVFDEDGIIDHGIWADYSGKMEVCQITMSSRGFYFGILILWALLMMMELRSCQRVANDIMAVRRVDTLDQMLDYADTDNFELGGRCLIIGLTRGIRTSVLVLVCLPRFIIGLALLFLGVQWLSSSASFADMTLNAMALEFVKNIDEILYQAILPRQVMKEIADTNVFKIEKRKTKKDLDADEWKGYKRTFGWLLFMALFLGIYGVVWQTVLPFNLSELSKLCTRQVKESQTALCEEHTWSGWSEVCYPYGVGGDALVGRHKIVHDSAHDAASSAVAPEGGGGGGGHRGGHR